MLTINLTSTFTTNPSLSCHKTSNEGLFISVAGTDAIEYKENIGFYLSLLELFNGENRLEDIIVKLEALGYGLTMNDLEEITEYWCDLNILKSASHDTDELIYQENYLKYDRQIKNFGILPGMTERDGVEFQKKLGNSSVGILGIGGVGSYVAYGLAAMGVGKLKLIDGDVVELSNTSRQVLYTEQDINRYKTEVACEKLNQVSKTTETKALNLFVNSSNIHEADSFFKDVDLIVQCADTPRGEIEYLVDDIACKHNIPWLTFTPFEFSKVSLGPFIIPGHTKSLRELIPPTNIIFDKKTQKINQRFIPTIMDPYNGIAAKMALIEIVKFLTGYKKSQVINKRLILDTDNWEVKLYDL